MSHDKDYGVEAEYETDAQFCFLKWAYQPSEPYVDISAKESHQLCGNIYVWYECLLGQDRPTLVWRLTLLILLEAVKSTAYRVYHTSLVVV